MDFTKFSDDNFDLKDWVNGAFQSQKDTNQNTEQFVATLITKLQVFIQEINNSIDDTCHQTVQNFPRILREIDVLKQEAFMLKEQMKSVRDDLIKVEKNTVNESMKLLLDLDIMRNNMVNVQIALQEADNWTTLTSDLDTILQTKDIYKISNHIESMQNSLTLLQDDTIDYVNRCSLLEDFKNKFETLMSPEIIASFNSKSIEQSKTYVDIFGKMNRLNELKKYYYQCEKAKMFEKISEQTKETNSTISASNSVVFSVNESTSNYSCLIGDALKNLLKNWLDYSIETWQNEIQWCKQIFNDSHAIVINLFTKVFEEFNKSFIKYLDEFKTNTKNDGQFLENLSQYKQETDRFVQTIYSSADSSLILTSKLEYINILLHQNVENSHVSDLLYNFFMQTYAPYKHSLKHYTILVVKYLKHELENNIKMRHNDTVECVQLLSNSVTKVFNLIDKEVERCAIFTKGCAFSLLIEAIKSFMKMYIEEFKQVVINLKERKSEQLTTSGSSNSKQLEMIEDWDTFRHFVKIIQIVGELIIKDEHLEEMLEKQIQGIFLHRLRASSVDTNATLSSQQQQQQQGDLSQFNLLSIQNFKDYLLDENERFKLNTLISIIESGDDYSIMKELLKPLFLLSENVHKYAFDVVFAPIKSLLKNISKSNMWTRNSGDANQQDAVPLFALAPQEYITKIGQYLLTLPQNFEPFTMQDNSNLVVALRKGKLPFLDEQDLSDDLTACWLDSIANATYSTFCEEILKIGQISVNAQRQLIIDIEFISSVFDDVGLKDFSNLSHVVVLLKINKEQFEDSTKNLPVRIVSAVRKMRGF